MKRFAAVALACAVAAGCGEGDAPVGPGPEVTRISVSPDTLVLPAIPATFRLTVIATFADSSTADVTMSRGTIYQSADRTIAAAGGGVVSAAGEGTTVIIVESGGAVDTASVAVFESAPIALASFDVAPLSLLLGVGEEGSVAGIAVWANGARLSATGLPFRYETDDAGVAAVSPNGVVSGIGAGATTVSISFRGLERALIVSVSEPRPTVSFERDILPVLQGNCTFAGCHSGTGTPQRGLRLNNYSNLIAGGANGPVVTAGSGAESRIILALRGTLAATQRMPLGRAPLAEFTIGSIDTWIDEGARDN